MPRKLRTQTPRMRYHVGKNTVCLRNQTPMLARIPLRRRRSTQQLPDSQKRTLVARPQRMQASQPHHRQLPSQPHHRQLSSQQNLLRHQNHPMLARIPLRRRSSTQMPQLPDSLQRTLVARPQRMQARQPQHRQLRRQPHHRQLSSQQKLLRHQNHRQQFVLRHQYHCQVLLLRHQYHRQFLLRHQGYHFSDGLVTWFLIQPLVKTTLTGKSLP